MDLKLPALGEGADSGTVVNLFVKEGDQITKDQPILELENEKAVATIPSTSAGTIGKIFVKTGEKISVGQRILSLSEKEEKPRSTKAKSETKAAKEQTEEEPAEQKQPEEPEEKEKREEEAPPEGKSKVGAAIAPSLRKVARDLGIDLERVRGSEDGGRII